MFGNLPLSRKPSTAISYDIFLHLLTFTLTPGRMPKISNCTYKTIKVQFGNLKTWNSGAVWCRLVPFGGLSLERSSFQSCGPFGTFFFNPKTCSILFHLVPWMFHPSRVRIFSYISPDKTWHFLTSTLPSQPCRALVCPLITGCSVSLVVFQMSPWTFGSGQIPTPTPSTWSCKSKT